MTAASGARRPARAPPRRSRLAPSRARRSRAHGRSGRGTRGSCRGTTCRTRAGARLVGRVAERRQLRRDRDLRLRQRERRGRAPRAPARRSRASPEGARPPRPPRRRRSRRPRSPNPSDGACACAGETSLYVDGRTHPALLARGPWSPDEVEARWLDEAYEPPDEKVAAADEAISALRERGSPSHDGVAARLVSHREEDGRLIIELQPARWALRLVEGDASDTRRRAVRHPRRRRALARRPARAMAELVAGPLGARRRRRGRRRRVAGRHARARAARGVERRARARCAATRSSASPTGSSCSSARPGCPTAPRSSATPSTTPTPGGRPTSAQWPDEADEPLRRMAALLACQRDHLHGSSAPRSPTRRST